MIKLPAFFVLAILPALPLTAAVHVKTEKGVVEGSLSADSQIRIFESLKLQKSPAIFLKRSRHTIKPLSKISTRQ